MRALLAIFAFAAAGCIAPTVPVDDPLPVPIPTFGDVVKVGDQGNEPVVRVAPDGTVYVAALHYVYVSRDRGATFEEVDFKGAIPVYASDTGLAVSPAGRAYVTFDWPYAGHTAVCATSDRGETWECNPLAVPGATDRMWILAPTEDDVYVITGQTLNRPTFAVSHDQGRTFETTHFDPTATSQGADLAWDPVQGLVVEAASSASGWCVRSFEPSGKYLGCEEQSIPPSERATLSVDSAGTWWATTCATKADPCAPAVGRSADRGKTWEVIPVPFSGSITQLPFVDAGPAGRVVTGWYEADTKTADDPAAEWRFVVVHSIDDGASWTSTVLTPEPVRKGNMCSAVTCLGEARYAGDFIGLDVDAAGDFHASWSRQTAAKMLPTGQQPRPLPSWLGVEYARTGR